jgi:hypothetical protein
MANSSTFFLCCSTSFRLNFSSKLNRIVCEPTTVSLVTYRRSHFFHRRDISDRLRSIRALYEPRTLSSISTDLRMLAFLCLEHSHLFSIRV